MDLCSILMIRHAQTVRLFKPFGPLIFLELNIISQLHLWKWVLIFGAAIRLIMKNGQEYTILSKEKYS